MPYKPRPDSQPQPGPRKERHRQYIHAVWAAPHSGLASPKLSGGYEVDKHGNPIATRGLNRPDQRYQQPYATVLANRQARAAAEQATTLVLKGDTDEVEVRSPSGNNYDVIVQHIIVGGVLTWVATTCDCPDWYKLNLSYPTISVVCKHMLIVQAVMNAPGFTELDWSVNRMGEYTGFDIRTIEEACHRGIITAHKVHNCWIIPAATAQGDGDTFKARVIQFPNIIDF